MKRLELFYRDGNNYKCYWEVSIDDKIFDNIPEPDCQGQHNIHDLGLTTEDIPLVQEWGYDADSDHPYVTIISVDGIPTDNGDNGDNGDS